MASHLLLTFEPISPYKNISVVLTEDVFRTQSNIFDEAFFPQRSSVVDIQLSSKYAYVNWMKKPDNCAHVRICF